MDTVFDTSARPLCRVKMGKTPNAGDFEAMFTEFENELMRARAFCVLADATDTTRIELDHVKQIVSFGERNRDYLALHLKALALVVPSAMVRGALKVAFQLNAPPHPYIIARNVTEGESYLATYVKMIA